MRANPLLVGGLKRAAGAASLLILISPHLTTPSPSLTHSRLHSSNPLPYTSVGGKKQPHTPISRLTFCNPPVPLFKCLPSHNVLTLPPFQPLQPLPLLMGVCWLPPLPFGASKTFNRRAAQPLTQTLTLRGLHSSCTKITCIVISLLIISVPIYHFLIVDVIYVNFCYVHSTSETKCGQALR